jgi:hypothetical protein
LRAGTQTAFGQGASATTAQAFGIIATSGLLKRIAGDP